MADINDKIAQQNLLLADPTKAEAAQKQIDNLERQKSVYEQMLPAIAQAEQAQLKYNQTLAMVQGPVNAFVDGLVAGLKGIVDGTMTAEEAFANMLQGIADSFLDMAAQILKDALTQQLMSLFGSLGLASKGGTGGSGLGGSYYNRPVDRLHSAPTSAYCRRRLRHQADPGNDRRSRRTRVRHPRQQDELSHGPLQRWNARRCSCCWSV